MNLSKIQEKLAAFEAAQQKKPQTNSDQPNIFWKPIPTKDAKGKEGVGTYTVRILPNVHDLEYPFHELKFYYNFGKTMLAPCTFDEPDPVVEAYNSIIPAGTKNLPKDEWMRQNAIRKKLEPVTRYYVAVLVRGQENEGPKFWGFSQKIFKDLLKLMSDADWGDITNMQAGHDVKVTITPAELTGTSYADITATPKPQKSVATDDPEVEAKIKLMPNLPSLFTKPTYEELQKAVNDFFKIKDDDVVTNPPVAQKQPEAQSPVKSTAPNAVADELDKMFADMPF